MISFQKFKEKLPSKENVYSSLMDEKIVIKSMNMFLKFRIDLK